MKEIKLTKGKKALIDDIYFEAVNKHKWQTRKDKHTFYAIRTIYYPNKKSIFMHNEIMNNKNTKNVVDHIDGNGLNNQKNNLRIATLSQNSMNQRKQIRKTSSKYKGVGWHKYRNKWQANIKKDQKLIYLGLFYTEVGAALAYDKKAKELFGEYARLNFPKEN